MVVWDGLDCSSYSETATSSTGKQSNRGSLFRHNSRSEVPLGRQHPVNFFHRLPIRHHVSPLSRHTGRSDDGFTSDPINWVNRFMLGMLIQLHSIHSPPLLFMFGVPVQVGPVSGGWNLGQRTWKGEYKYTPEPHYYHTATTNGPHYVTVAMTWGCS